MVVNPISRRDILKLAALSLSALACSPLLSEEGCSHPNSWRPIGLGRVTVSKINIYQEPSFASERFGEHRRDQVVTFYEKIISPHGPKYNPTWYRIGIGYAHSGYLQRVKRRFNPLLSKVPESGHLCEVTVPFTQSYRYFRTYGWVPLYRLYYQSTHWVTAIEAGPDDKPWYRITDERLRVHYYVSAPHLRPISAKELSPISPCVSPEDKRILVLLEDQTLTAFEGDQPVFHTHIASGIPSKGPTPNGIPTTTPSGRFLISRKMPVRHMGDGELTNSPEAYELPGVPWVCTFVSTGVAFHGTYWHNNFGRTMSHGCVNMRYEDAKWLFRWTMPNSTAHDWIITGKGTVVDVV